VKVQTVAPSALPDWLLGRGRLFVTTAEIAELTGLAESSVPVHLHRARSANKIVSVTKGGWVPVPPVYRSAGAPPPIHYIDYVMEHLGHAYYVGFLSAARIHGASHQVPMVLQVVTPALLRDREIGGSRLQFIRRSDTAQRATQRHDTEAGLVTISSPETTVLDIVEAPERAAGLDNVANVLGELIIDDRIDVDALAEAAAGYPRTVVQRTGWLLQHMAGEVDGRIDLAPLRPLVDGADYTPLDPRFPVDGDRGPVWHVVENTDVDHDL
jgi:predicted transcriptional regulator of viral defense system